MIYKTAFKVSLLYFLFGFAWILFSDQIVDSLTGDPEILTRIQTLKGWIFVLLTSVLVFLLCQRGLTELMGAQKAQQKTEAAYRRFFENAPVGIYETTVEGHLVKANSAFARIAGYATSAEAMTELSERGLASLFADPEAFKRIRKAAAADTGWSNFPIPYRSKDGSIVYGNVYTRAIRGRDGAVTGLEGVVENVTGKVLAERAYQRSQRRFQALFDRVPVAIQGFLPDLTIRYWNQASERTFGYTADEAIGRNIRDFLLPEGERRLFSYAVARLDQNAMASYSGEFQVRHKSGDRIPVFAKLVMVRDADKTEIFCLDVDLSEVRQAREDQKESEERLRAIFDNVAVGIVLVDTEGRFVQCNDKWIEMVGYSQEALQTMTHIELTHSADVQAGRLNFARLIGGDIRQFQMETRYRRKDGEAFWASLSMSAIRNEHREVVLAIGVIVDIDETRKARDAQIQLEKLLIQSQKSEALGTLAGGIAHDFNNILFGILGYTEMAITETPEGASARDYMESVREAALRSKELVQQILTISRQSDIAVDPVKPKFIVKEALKLLRASLPATIEIQSDFISDAYVLADPVQIHQVALNLCTNAAHAMEDRGGTLSLTLRDIEIDAFTAHRHPDLKQGRYLLFAVSDTGTGIPKSHIEKVFDPYFTTKPTGKGTGLGLAMVLGIARQIGGTATIYSKEGEGTTVNVMLPAFEKPGHEVIRLEDAPVKGSGRILFVDDEKQIVDLGVVMLRHLGYEVAAFVNSHEALEHFKSAPGSFDLVITDYTMPQMTGLQLAQAIKQIRPDTPVILSSGFSEQITDRKAREIGISCILRKPVTLKDLAEMVHEVIVFEKECSID